MSDTLQRFLFEELHIRGELVQFDATWRAVLERHDYPPSVREPLGELMAAGMLLSATLKFTGSITLQVQSDGPISLMVVECTSARTVRGIAHWQGDVPAGDLPARFGEGRLAITIDPGNGKERYQGIVPLEGASLAEALDGYLERSEQLPTRMWLAADGANVGGLLVQVLPHEAREADAWDRVNALGATVTADELLRLPHRDLIRRLFHEEDLRVFEAEPVSFRCTCSRERVSNALRGIGHDEVMDIVRERGNVEVRCEFCNRQYLFDAVDADALFAEQPAGESSSTRH
jgi:molecular chaperone Hsp33